VFEEHATEAVLFLDVDMIFLDKFDTVLLDLSDRSFMGSSGAECRKPL
jgi:hypothetical protein